MRPAGPGSDHASQLSPKRPPPHGSRLPTLLSRQPRARVPSTASRARYAAKATVVKPRQRGLKTIEAEMIWRRPQRMRQETALTFSSTSMASTIRAEGTRTGLKKPGIFGKGRVPKAHLGRQKTCLVRTGSSAQSEARHTQSLCQRKSPEFASDPSATRYVRLL